MPAVQRGQPYKLKSGKGWGLRYYDENGVRRRKSPFPSKSAALAHYRNVIEPRLRGEPEPPEPEPERTLGEFVPIYLKRHAATVREPTIDSLRERLSHAVAAHGDVPLRELERMSGDLADWRAAQPEGVRYGRMQALRQTLEAAVRWGYMDCNPAKLAGKNPQPPPRPIRAYTRAELEAVAAELAPQYRPLPAFGAATGLRPEEWAVAERRDVDRPAGVVRVRRTLSVARRRRDRKPRVQIVELAKTSRSRREVPLSDHAREALDDLSPRLDSPYLFAARRGGPFDLHNFRRREWAPAIEASGVAKPARLYDMRSTFASNALAAGVSVFELARVMGTSVAMIERHYGTLLEGAGADIARRLSAFVGEQGRAEDDAADV